MRKLRYVTCKKEAKAMDSGQSIRQLDPVMDTDHRVILESLKILLQSGKMLLVIRGEEINGVAFFFKDDQTFYDVVINSSTEVTLDADFELEE